MKVESLKSRKLILVATFGVLTTGCAHFDPDRVATDFGTSHTAMLDGQYFDPQAARNPSPNAPTGMDGAKATNILKTYRDDVSDREFEDTQQAINILTGGAE